MRFFFATLFSIIVLFILIWHLYKEHDIFSPIVIFCLLALVRYLPGIAYIEDWGLIRIDEKYAAIVTIYELLAIICTVLGYMFYNRLRHKVVVYTISYNSFFPFKSTGWIFFVIGALSGLYLVHILGGVYYILSGIKKTNATTGNSYIRALMFLMIIGMVFVIYDRKLRKKRIISFEIILMFCIYAMFYVIQTSRSPVLEALMILIMVYHYCIKRIKIGDILKPKVVILAFFCMLFIVIMPAFRTDQGFSNFSFVNALRIGFTSISKIFDEFCYTARDGFVFTEYNMHNYWYGANFINLFCAPLPSVIFSWKPPVDDGMYLANAVMGYFVKPPSNNLPWYNSYPFSTPAGLYINFGIIGVIIGSMILGWVYGEIYSILKKTKYDVVIVVLYQLIIYQFEFSCLSIVQTLTPAVFTIIFAKLLGGWQLKCQASCR